MCLSHTTLADAQILPAWAGSQEGGNVVLERNKTTGHATLTGVGSRKASAHQVCVGKLRSFMKMWVIGTESNPEEGAFVSFPRVTKPLSCGLTFSLYFQSLTWTKPNTLAACPGMETVKLAPLEFIDLLLCWHKSDQLQAWAKGPPKFLLNTSFAR